MGEERVNEEKPYTHNTYVSVEWAWNSAAIDISMKGKALEVLTFSDRRCA